MQDFLAQIGGGVIGGFRFNALTQQYESFTPGAPAFVNQLQTLNRGDALLLNMQLTGLVEQVDLLAGGARQIALQTGSNLVSYTGASGPIAAILADLATLTAAFVFDAPTQQWLAYRPGAAAFLNQVSTLRASAGRLPHTQRPGDVDLHGDHRRRRSGRGRIAGRPVFHGDVALWVEPAVGRPVTRHPSSEAAAFWTS